MGKAQVETAFRAARGDMSTSLEGDFFDPVAAARGLRRGARRPAHAAALALLEELEVIDIDDHLRRLLAVFLAGPLLEDEVALDVDLLSLLQGRFDEVGHLASGLAVEKGT